MKARAARLVAAASVVTFLSLTFVGSALAHAAITSVTWDNSANPTRLIASTGGDQISNAPGDSYLRIFNASGARVDRNDAAVSGNNTQITASVQPGLSAGTYRVDWKVVSEDGHESTGSLSVTVTAAAATVTAQPAAISTGPAAMPAAAHSHNESDHHDAPATPTAVGLPAGPVNFEVKLAGSNIVPTAVTSTASAFARFTFNPTNSRLDYAVWVSGISPNQITGLHVHRGSASENGGHAFDILSTGPTNYVTFAGSAILAAEDVSRLMAGNLYLMLHTQAYPGGAARGQLQLPSAAVHDQDDHDHSMPLRPGSTIRPPSTGDAGLATGGYHRDQVAAMIAVLVVALGLPFAGMRKRI